MLSHLLKRINERTSVLETFLCLCDACDEAASDSNSALQRELSARAALGANLTEERVFRHCATITQLYAIYEAFCEASLEFWLTRLPRYQPFPNLPQNFRNAYRCGIARIIHDADKRKYKHVILDNVLETYLHSLRGESPWQLVGDALTAHENNLRRPEFEQMFHSAGLDGVWSSLEKNPSIAGITTDGNSLEKMILDLVTFRNEAAHGAPDEILGVKTLREWVCFVRAFCEALAEFLIHRILREEAAHKPEIVFGVVTETFKNRIIVAICDRGTLNVGDFFHFLRESDCIHARVDSLQVQGVGYQTVTVDQPGLEVGIKTSVEVPKKAKLVKIEVSG